MVLDIVAGGKGGIAGIVEGQELHIQIMEQAKVRVVFQHLGLQHNEQIMEQDLVYKIPVPVVAVVER